MNFPKMKSSPKKQIPALLILLGVTACSSLHEQPALDALSQIKDQAAATPFVEGYFEFVGPHAKWAGPSAWVIHIDAREGEFAKVKAQPPVAPESAPRSPAQAGARPQAPGVTVQAARAQLANLAAMMAPDRRPQSTLSEACLHPIRVRLIRQDGAVLDQIGCRSVTGWESQVSKATGFFMAPHGEG